MTRNVRHRLAFPIQFLLVLSFFSTATGQDNTIPSNDSCESSILLDDISDNDEVFTLSGSTLNATNDYTNICGENLSNEPTVWFKYGTPATAQPKVVTLSTCNPGTDFDTALTVYQGPLCDSLQCVVGIDDDLECRQGTERHHSTVSWHASPGALYFVLVHGSQPNHSGNFELTVSVTEPVDGTTDNSFPTSGSTSATDLGSLSRVASTMVFAMSMVASMMQIF